MILLYSLEKILLYLELKGPAMRVQRRQKSVGSLIPDSEVLVS